jgi:O-methyltransferase
MIKGLIQKFLNARGFAIIRYSAGYNPEHLNTFQRVRDFTATSTERLAGLVSGIEYIVENRIPGAFVECGVWRGGSMMAAALTLMRLGDTSRDLYLFDTFEGMSAPTEADVMFDGQRAEDILKEKPPAEGFGNYWCVARIDEVKRNLISTGYPSERLHFIKGKVEETIPHQAPAEIALLRLDTDWYESTAHELDQLYPRLIRNGVLIIDDYGHWLGARKAVDEYFARRSFRPLLNRLDYTGRLAIKSE